MRHRIEVENVKCGGCVHTISEAVAKVNGVNDVTVDVAEGVVSFDGPDSAVPDVTQRLAKLGYPATGSVDGVRSAVAKVKSFASCAVGRLES